MLYALNFYRNRLLITFAGLPALVQKLKSWRSKSAIFRLQFCGMWVIWVYLYLCLYEPVNALQVYIYCGKAWPLAELCKASRQSVAKWHLWTNYEIVPKSMANFEKILFRFFVWEIHTPAGIKIFNSNFYIGAFQIFSYSHRYIGAYRKNWLQIWQKFSNFLFRLRLLPSVIKFEE